MKITYIFIDESFIFVPTLGSVTPTSGINGKKEKCDVSIGSKCPGFH